MGSGMATILVFAAGAIFGYWYVTGQVPDVVPDGLPGSEAVESAINKVLPPRS